MNDTTTGSPAHGREVVSNLLGGWLLARAELRASEEAEHPAITDKFGRVWTWKAKNVYVHDCMAWPARVLADPDSYGLPLASALNNPNYTFCGTCRGI